MLETPPAALTGEQEDRFRQAWLPADVARTRLALALACVPIAGFAANDWALLGPGPRLLALVAVRLAFLAGTLLLLRRLARVTSAAAFDRAVLGWSGALVALLVAINATRPQAFVSHVIVAMAVAFLLCLALPLRFRHQLALCAALAAGELAVLAGALRSAPPGLLSAALSFLVVTALALAGARELHAHRRREHLAREALQRVNGRLAEEVEQRTAEVRRARDELGRFFDLSPDLLAIADPEGRFQRLNAAWEAVLGYPPARLERLRPLDLAHADDVETCRAALETLRRTSGPVAFASRCRGADGAHRWLEWRAVRVEGAAYLVARDVTERRALEDQLRHAQKLEAVGRLAGGVAHEVNNQLTAILGSSEVLLDGAEPGGTPHEEAADIREAAYRAAAVVRQLLVFSRGHDARPELVEPGTLVRRLEGMLRRLAGDDVTLEVRATPGLGSVRADPGHLEQVLVNLVVNARDAMPAGGRLALEVGAADLRDAAGALPPGAYVRLAVRDTGTGMSPEVQAHLFEPFFTTKEVGKGKGLGLAAVYGLVKQARGDVRVRSEAGKGTLVEVLLPLAPAGEGPGEPPRPVAIGTETVLVVDDDPLVRSTVVTGLRRRGFQVLEAGDGEEALRVACARGGPLDLLVTVAVMPRLGGAELAERVRLAHPGVAVLFTSGFGDGGAAGGDLPARHELVRKPFTAGELALRIRSLLDRRRGGAPPSGSG